MDSKGQLASAKGHITSTLVGDMNRNGYQQLRAGRLGGDRYDWWTSLFTVARRRTSMVICCRKADWSNVISTPGGHAAPSALGFTRERAGLFPQHEWQNRLKGGLPLTKHGLESEPLILKGLDRLYDEAFGASGFALGMDEPPRAIGPIR